MTTSQTPAPPMTSPTSPKSGQPLDRRTVGIGIGLMALLGALALGLILLVGMGGANTPGASTAPDASGFEYAAVRQAPPLKLLDQDGNRFDLAQLKGQPVLVFFGYTHCPDVCPETVGVVSQVLKEVGAGPRAVFASIDPDRDDTAAMKKYLTYLPPAFIGLSGTPQEVAENANGWGVKYAKVDSGSAGGYSMSHTADIYLVDAQGLLRAHFPFKTPKEPMVQLLRRLMAESAGSATAPTVAPGASEAVAPGSGDPEKQLRVSVISSSIWAGGSTPLIVTLGDAQGQPVDASVKVTLKVIGANSQQAGVDIPTTAVLPPGERIVNFVGFADIPSPGQWRLDVLTSDGRTGSTVMTALDQGSTTPVGAPAPKVDTPTLADVGGNAKLLTTVVDAVIDDRLYTTSTADALAAGKPYVLVIDSNRFRVSPACGRAITMIRYLLDRWPDVAFIHLEPFVYQVITDEPVLSGSIDNPPLNQWTEPWGIGPAPWPATEMPWIFVVDEMGVVRAKYTGIVGSADVDVIVSLITGSGVVGQ